MMLAENSKTYFFPFSSLRWKRSLSDFLFPELSAENLEITSSRFFKSISDTTWEISWPTTCCLLSPTAWARAELVNTIFSSFTTRIACGDESNRVLSNEQSISLLWFSGPSILIAVRMNSLHFVPKTFGRDHIRISKYECTEKYINGHKWVMLIRRCAPANTNISECGDMVRACLGQWLRGPLGPV